MSSSQSRRIPQNEIVDINLIGLLKNTYFTPSETHAILLDRSRPDLVLLFQNASNDTHRTLIEEGLTYEVVEYDGNIFATIHPAATPAIVPGKILNIYDLKL